MSLILSGSDGVSDIDGTVSTPAIRGTDSNTGIFFPAADTIAFSEGGAEAMRITSAGDVGIGTSSPAVKTEISGTAAASNLALRITNTATDGYSTLQMGDGNAGIYRNGSTQSGYAGASSLNLITVGAHNIGFATNNTERMRITSGGDLQFNSGYGSVATAYGCRAWVNFQGTDTVAIRASGNVSSVSDLETGTYQVNFTTAMPDTNYAVTGTCERNGNNSDNPLTSHRTRTTTSVVINTSRANTDMFDMLAPTAAIFR